MAIFKRGISSEEFINKLNKLKNDESSFWYKMLKDKELFIAVRDEYISVYYKGQRLCNILHRKQKVVAEIHKKYLGRNESGYFHLENGRFDDENVDIKNLTELAQIKEKMNSFAGREKSESYVNSVLDENSFVIDVEITFVDSKVKNPKKHSDYALSSIDFLSLNDNTLVFYEAKHYANSEIRSRTSPKVFDQINRYEKVLAQHKIEILKSYQLVLRNLEHLNILSFEWAKNVLKIDLFPKLIVFGVEKDEREDIHLQKLRKQFGSRLILIPNS